MYFHAIYNNHMFIHNTVDDNYMFVSGNIHGVNTCSFNKNNTYPKD